DADVQRDERASHICAGELRDGPWRAHVAGVARVLGAADPDRCDGHAVRADRPAALGAREAGFPVRVPIAGWHAAARLAASASTSPSRRPKTYRPPSES